MIAFLIKSSICMILFFGLYRIFLRREKLFSFTRYYLIASVLFSLAVPFISFTAGFYDEEASHGLISVLQSMPDVNPVQEEKIFSESAASGFTAQPLQQNYAPSFDFASVFLVIYFIGLTLMLIRFCRNIFVIQKKFRHAEKIDYQWYKVALIEHSVNPFSFFRTIFVNKYDYLRNRIASDILNHELEHIRQYHSADIIFFEIIHIVYWFNPVLLLYNRAAKINHEYLADEAVIKNSSDVRSYANELISFITFRVNVPLTSGFSPSTIRLRLLMLNTTANIWGKRVRIVSTLLISALLFIALSMKPAEPGSREPSEKVMQHYSDTLDQTLKYNAVRIENDNLTKHIILLSSAVVSYGNTEISAYSINVDVNDGFINASGRKDANGKIIGKVLFKEGDKMFNADSLVYNYKTKKARVFNISGTVDINKNQEPDPVIENVYFRGNDFSPLKSLVVIDGKIYGFDETIVVDPGQIKTINVLKGKAALRKYGRHAKNGVVAISTYGMDKKSVPDTLNYRTILTINDKRPEGKRSIPVSELYSVETGTHPLPPDQAGKKPWKTIYIMTRDYFRISGRVVQKNGEPVAGVKLTASNNGLKVRTDKEGRFLLKDVITLAEVTLSAKGFEPLKFAATGEVFMKDLKITLDRKNDTELNKDIVLNHEIKDFSGTWKFNKQLSHTFLPDRYISVYNIRQYDSDSIIVKVTTTLENGRIINSIQKYLLNTTKTNVDKLNRKSITTCFINPDGKSFSVSYLSSSIVGLSWNYNSLYTYSLSDDGRQLILRRKDFIPPDVKVPEEERDEIRVYEKI